ncbi:MAG: glycosyltransferase, partial [Desulfofundulus sp.]
FIPEQEVPYYFRASDLVVLPYTLFHSQSGVLMQAYKYGVPVVVTNVGALGETVRADDTGVVIDSLDPSAFARKLTEVLAMPQLLARYSANALAKVEGPYNWANVARQTIKVYQRVVHM